MENMGVKKNHIIVTGGAGFIGSHLVEELLERGKEVIVVDSEVHSDSYFAKRDFQKKATLEILDIRNIDGVNALFTKYSPSFVFHLAAEPIVVSSFNDPVSTFETNIMGTVHILEAVRKNPIVQGVIVASSDKAYGKTKEAYTEETPLQGDHPYDVSKSCADLITQAYYKTYGTPVAITRFGNVYGEGDIHYDRIIPGICLAVAKNEVLEIRSNGEYVRDYIYVKDVAKGYLTLLDHMVSVKGEAFNFSSNITLSVLDLIRKSQEILGEKIKYKILNTAKNEIPYQHLDDQKIRKLGWQQETSFEEGLKKTFSWYQKI